MKAFIDIETGGFSITKNGVCEIAMIITDNRLNILEEFQTLIKPYHRENGEPVTYKAEAMQINGISLNDLHEKGADVKAAAAKVISLIESFQVKTLIGHNSAAFDIPRLDYLIARFHCKTIKKMFQIDTLQVAKDRYKLESYTLENLCTQFNITNSKAHSALSDAKATLELYKKLLNQ